MTNENLITDMPIVEQIVTVQIYGKITSHSKNLGKGVVRILDLSSTFRMK